MSRYIVEIEFLVPHYTSVEVEAESPLEASKKAGRMELLTS